MVSINMAVYVKQRRTERLERAKVALGGVCIRCGTNKNLEFDHIDPSSKESELINLALHSWDKFWSEVEKCQILCSACHKLKTNKDNGWGGHGIGRYSRKCRCDICRNAWNSYMREYKHKRRVPV